MTDVDALKAMITEAIAAGVVPPDFLKKFDAAAKDPRVCWTESSRSCLP